MAALSKSTCYALYAMAEMATAADGLVTVAGIAARYRLPPGALAKVLQQLVRAGLALGTRGIGGGYRQARPPSKVTVREVMAVFEPPSTTGRCLVHTRPGERCPPRSACLMRWLFEEVDELVTSTYESVTIATLVARAGNLTRPGHP